MATERNIVSQQLNRIKEKHGLTHKSWAESSGVPLGTISRYLGYNVGVPNFAHIGAMLGCIGESVDEFYAVVNGAAQSAGADPASSAAAAKIDPQQDAGVLRSMQERVAEQSEVILEHMATIHEQDAQLRELRAEMRSLEKIIAERDASISRRDLRIAESASELKAERRKAHRLTVALVALIALVVALCAVYIWDVSNLHKGLTALLNPGM